MFISSALECARVVWEDLFFGLQDHWRPAAHQEAAQLLRVLRSRYARGISRRVSRRLQNPFMNPIEAGEEGRSVGGRELSRHTESGFKGKRLVLSPSLSSGTPTTSSSVSSRFDIGVSRV
jgi:hypothetical protein